MPRATTRGNSENPHRKNPLVAKIIFHYFSLETRQRIVRDSGSIPFRTFERVAPLNLRHVLIDSDSIDFDVFVHNYSFKGTNTLVARSVGVGSEERKFRGSREEMMKRILKLYLYRPGTVVHKLWIMDQKALSYLKEIKVVDYFEIRNSNGALLRDMGPMSDEELQESEWTLVDRKPAQFGLKITWDLFFKSACFSDRS